MLEMRWVLPEGRRAEPAEQKSHMTHVGGSAARKQRRRGCRAQGKGMEVCRDSRGRVGGIRLGPLVNLMLSGEQSLAFPGGPGKWRPGRRAVPGEFPGQETPNYLREASAVVKRNEPLGCMPPIETPGAPPSGGRPWKGREASDGDIFLLLLGWFSSLSRS